MTEATGAGAAAAADPYFEIKISGKQILLRIHPPEGGRRANLTDIQRELRLLEIAYRPETLFDIYKRATNDFEALASHELTRFDVNVEVSKDRQRAAVTIVPPDLGEDRLTPARIKEALEAAKVEKGIRYDVIKQLLARQTAVERVLVAQGQPKQDGVDGRIEMLEPPSEAAWLDDNTADYRELNLIKNVLDDDLIARITLPTAGTDGFDVHARALKARPGKRAKFKLGRNVRLSEDGRELVAVKAGYVVRRGDKISVENVLEVENVNAETGNIRFHGVVRVHGQVEDSFLVEADNGIEVGGSVGKATLRCKGDIRIQAGAIGAQLECDGNLSARFLSECTVRAGGHVLVDEYVLHSNVESKRTVKVARETTGFITGGRVRAGTEIWAAKLGSEVSEEHTVLEVGGGVNVRKRFDALQERIDGNLETFDKQRKNLGFLQAQRETAGDLDARQRELYDQTVGACQKVIDDLLRQAGLHHEMLRALADPEEDSGIVFVAQQASPGATIQIQTSRVNLRDPVDACAFMLMGGVLKAMPYGQALKLHKQMQTQRTRGRA